MIATREARVKLPNRYISYSDAAAGAWIRAKGRNSKKEASASSKKMSNTNTPLPETNHSYYYKVSFDCMSLDYIDFYQMFLWELMDTVTSKDIYTILLNLN